MTTTPTFLKAVSAAAVFAAFSASSLIVTAVFAHEWMAPNQAAERNNPIAATPESVAKGRELFVTTCAYCHGENGRGMTAEQAGLAKNPPDLRKRLQRHSTGDFFWKVRNGRGDMPSFKESLREEEIWHIINFLQE